MHITRVLLLIALGIGISACRQQSNLPSLGLVPDFDLTDQTGSAFHSAQKLAGKVWIADFIYTTCSGPCPRMSSQMAQLRSAFPGNSQLQTISFTIDPDRDTPPMLAVYAKRYGADPAFWHLLTGPRAELKRLDYDTFHLGEINGDLTHSTRFVTVDGQGRIRGYYDTSEPESIPTLIKDVRSLLREQS